VGRRPPQRGGRRAALAPARPLPVRNYAIMLARRAASWFRSHCATRPPTDRTWQRRSSLGWFTRRVSGPLLAQRQVTGPRRAPVAGARVASRRRRSWTFCVPLHQNELLVGKVLASWAPAQTCITK